MASVIDYAARGKVTSVTDGGIVFTPAGTNYELHLDVEGGYTGPVGSAIEGIIRAQGQKLWTVPSGGNFIVPIVGPPRIVQGRVRRIDEGQIVIQAGATFIISVSQGAGASSLARGPIALNTMVNVVLMPGARFELIAKMPGVAARDSVVQSA